MGFSRYYTIDGNLDPIVFSEYSRSCKSLCDQISSKWFIDISDGEGGSPIFNDSEICFNGVGEDTWEIFIISINSTGFNSVKTKIKPYDLHVEACLILATLYFKNIEISSDAGEESTQLVYEFVKTFFRNYKISQIIDK